MTDNIGVNLTVQEAVSDEDLRHNIAIHLWRAIDRLHLSRGNVIGFEGLNKTYITGYTNRRTGFIHIDGNTGCVA